MATQGTATLDFGAFPGKSDASVAVASAGIVAGSLVEAWIRPVATADHSDDEHMLETLKVFAADIVAGVGFTIYGFNTSEINEPYGGRSNAAIATPRPPKGTRIYGTWTIAWVWN